MIPRMGFPSLNGLRASFMCTTTKSSYFALLRNPERLAEKNADSHTLLHVASTRGYTDTVIYLLNANAEVRMCMCM
jgi:ankyrin repeat protein